MTIGEGGFAETGGGTLGVVVCKFLAASIIGVKGLCGPKLLFCGKEGSAMIFSG